MFVSRGESLLREGTALHFLRKPKNLEGEGKVPAQLWREKKERKEMFLRGRGKSTAPSGWCGTMVKKNGQRGEGGKTSFVSEKRIWSGRCGGGEREGGVCARFHSGTPETNRSHGEIPGKKKKGKKKKFLKGQRRGSSPKGVNGSGSLKKRWGEL